MLGPLEGPVARSTIGATEKEKAPLTRGLNKKTSADGNHRQQQHTTKGETVANKELANHLWTARWGIDNDSPKTARESITKALIHLGYERESEDAEEVERPSRQGVGQKLLWHPEANREFSHTTRGQFRLGYPEGAIVHYTSGHCETEQDAINVLRDQNIHAYWLIGPTGQIYATHPLDRHGWHAGESSWPAWDTTVSQHTLGIEVACAGQLDDNNRSWFGRHYPADRVRRVQNSENIRAGNYVMYTDAQELALEELLLWLKANNPGVFDLNLVLGHDEVSPGRKVDPGGSLSMTMPEFRKRLVSEYDKWKAVS